MHFEVNLFVIRQDYASKDAFLPIHLVFQSIFGLKTVIKNRKCRIGREVRKAPKSVCIFFF